MSVVSDFKSILDAVRRGGQAAFTFEAEGDTYTRGFYPGERLILLGAGNIAQPLAEFGAALGFSVAVADGRPLFANAQRFPMAEEVICDTFPNAIKKLNITSNDYVCVITRGHVYDADCLREILPGTMPKYLGMIGSKRRVIELLNMLEAEGYSRERLDSIHTPIGLAIGALTTPEIAVSIAAELVQVRREGTDRHGHGAALTMQNTDFKFLEAVAEDPAPKALLVVYDTSGSTPVKAGAIMAVDENLRTYGTIGGGCGEGEAINRGFHIIGTGMSETMTIDMSNDIAAEEGMVCGGEMKVAVIDVTA